MEPPEGRGRRAMEAHLGPIGRGARRLAVAGTADTPPELNEPGIVAYEFDTGFRYVAETCVHVPERVGDAARQEGSPTWTSTWP